MNKKKIMIIAAVLVLGGGYEAKSMLMPPPKAPVPKIAGALYIMPGQFLVNLTDGRYGKVNVALDLAPGQSDGSGATAATTPPDGYGTLPEEAAVRAVITNDLTDQSSNALIDARARGKLLATILAGINKSTDVKVKQVMFTDVAVQ
jgi:flagellar basal body-associated protein FliL